MSQATAAGARMCQGTFFVQIHARKTKVKTEKIIEKITFISTWIYWK
jgi:hypothetical protein